MLDEDHLERQVQGDGDLRNELLVLFRERLIALAPAVCEQPGHDGRTAAHALKGASLAVGAFPLAKICESVEIGGGEVARREAELMIEATGRRVEEMLRQGG